jgi:hypothetical protein
MSPISWKFFRNQEMIRTWIAGHFVILILIFETFFSNSLIKCGLVVFVSSTKPVDQSTDGIILLRHETSIREECTDV